MKRLAILLLVLAPALLWASDESNNAVSASQTSAVAYFAAPHGSVAFTNDGANEVYVKVWKDGDPVVSGWSATITTATNGARRVDPGETWILSWDQPWEAGRGYVAYSYICDTGESTTFRVFAK